MPLASREAPSTDCVTDVVSLSTAKQMEWVAAHAVIACVANNQTFRNRAVRELVRHPMGMPMAVMPLVQKAVALVIGLASPKPAPI